MKKTIKDLEKALQIAQQKGDKLQETKYCVELGKIYFNLSKFEKAADYYYQKLKIAKEIENKSEEAGAYRSLSVVYNSLSNFKRSSGYAKKALKIFQKLKDIDGEIKCYISLGTAYYGLCEFKKAIKKYEHVLQISQELKNKEYELAANVGLSVTFNLVGNPIKTLEYHKKALQISQETKDIKSEARCYVNIGIFYEGIGELRKALEYYENALGKLKKTKDKFGETKCYECLGNIYVLLGNSKKAIEYYEKLNQLAIEIKNKSLEADSYIGFGSAYLNLRKFKKSITNFDNAKYLKETSEDKRGEIKCHAGLGDAFFGLRFYYQAIQDYDKALKIAEEINDELMQAYCLGNLANTYDSSYPRQTEKAIEYQKKALSIVKEIGAINHERVVNYNLGVLCYDTNIKQAYDYCKRSIHLSEIIVGKLTEEPNKMGFYSQTSDAYSMMVSLCLKLGNRTEAFQYSEGSRSRTFLDLLATTTIKPTVTVTSTMKILLDSEEDKLERLRKIQTSHLKKIKIIDKPGEVDSLLEDLNQIYDNISKFDPEYVFMRRAKPLSFDKIQKLLTSQKKDTVLIEYYVTDKETFIFVVTSKNKKLHVKTVPLSTMELAKFKESFESEVAKKVPNRNGNGKKWIELSKYLIEPISEFLTENELVYFVPFGMLHYLPLHALELNGEPLIKNHPVAYIPSASLIQFCQNKGSGKMQSCLSFAVVKEKLMMKTIEKTSNAVADLFDSKEIYTNDLATKQKVLEKCNDKDVIHFSCHGKFDSKDPLSSGIELYNEEILSAKEIFDLKLNSEIVTLGACETGVSERSKGDELVGLTRAFLYAGTASVVVSLWNVDVLATRTLLVEFYKQLTSGVDRVSALQEAQKKAMKKYPNMPHYWAPFILVGKT